ncbi:MAG: HIT family protein [Mobilicoccus sp.]|nr:HIT family protein [Mobilicoccus sp.]
MTIFSRIIAGEIPGRFVWSDERCVAFLSADQITPGHTLVVPRQEVDAWHEADGDLMAHLMTVAHTIGRAQVAEYGCARPGLLIQGYEVPHVHLHVWPTNSPADFDVSRADTDPDPAAMDETARRLRDRLRRDDSDNAAAHVPQEPGNSA